MNEQHGLRGSRTEFIPRVSKEYMNHTKELDLRLPEGEAQHPPETENRASQARGRPLFPPKHRQSIQGMSCQIRLAGGWHYYALHLLSE